MYVRATQYCASLKQGNSPDQRLDVLITGSPSLAIPNTHAQRPERSRLPRQRGGERGLRWSKLSRLSRPSRPSRLRRLRRLSRPSKPSRPSRPSRPSKRDCRCTCDFGRYRAFTCDFYIPPPCRLGSSGAYWISRTTREDFTLRAFRAESSWTGNGPLLSSGLAFSRSYCR